MFYLPHGMTIDHHGNTWVTDVAMHQVFKFRPNSLYPSITLGQRFQPGVLPGYLCKPTSVAGMFLYSQSQYSLTRFSSVMNC